MFHDPHGKVFSVFLDTLVLVVPVYHIDLTDWLYICLTRLLTKTGADLLLSVQGKVQKALDVIRQVFLALFYLSDHIMLCHEFETNLSKIVCECQLHKSKLVNDSY